MNYFDILLAKKMAGSAPLPENAYLLTAITDGDLTSAKSKPLPSVSVAVTDADELDVFVGDSESVISDNEPYLYRQSKGGRMVSERLVGASVAWNQLAQPLTLGNWVGVNDRAFADGAATFTVSQQYGALYALAPSEMINGHKYLINASVKMESFPESNVIRVSIGAPGYSQALPNMNFNSSNSTGGAWNRKTIICVFNTNAGVPADYNNRIFIQDNRASDWTEIQFKGILVIDLTLMFGSTIADYVYSLEQSTAGAGVAWLKSYGFFTEDYYAYDSGSLKSVQASEKKVRDASDNIIATYPLPSSDLRGLYKLSSNKLYCNGDIQYGDGWRLRRYGIVDLGTLEWTTTSTSNVFALTDDIAGITRAGSVGVEQNNILCTRYEATSVVTLASNTPNKKCSVNVFGKKLVIRDDTYSDATTFKNSLSGVYLVYELETPTWEKTNPFTNPQTVGSTEEFVANLPVGHESKYYDGDIHHSYIYAGDARAKVTGDVDIVNGTAPNGTCSVCVVMPDGDEIWSDAGDVTAEIWT